MWLNLTICSNFTNVVRKRETVVKGKQRSDQFNIHIFIYNYIFSLLSCISTCTNSIPSEYLIHCFHWNSRHSVQSIWVPVLFLLSSLKCRNAGTVLISTLHFMEIIVHACLIMFRWPKSPSKEAIILHRWWSDGIPSSPPWQGYYCSALAWTR